MKRPTFIFLILAVCNALEDCQQWSTLSSFNNQRVSQIPVECISNIPIDTFKTLSSTQAGQFTGSAVGNLLTAQISKIPAASFAGFTSNNVYVGPGGTSGLRPGSLDLVSKEQFGQFTLDTFPSIDSRTLATVPAPAYAGLNAKTVKAAQSSQVGAWSAYQISNISAASFAGFTSKNVYVGPGGTSGLRPFSLGLISRQQLGNITATTVAAIDPRTISGIRAKAFAGLTSSQLNAMTKLCHAFRMQQVGYINQDVFPAFSSSCVENLEESAFNETRFENMLLLTNTAIQALDTTQFIFLMANHGGTKVVGGFKGTQIENMYPVRIEKIKLAIAASNRALCGSPPSLTGREYITWLQLSCATEASAKTALHGSGCSSAGSSCSLHPGTLLGLQENAVIQTLDFSTLCIQQLHSILPSVMRSMSPAQWVQLKDENILELGPVYMETSFRQTRWVGRMTSVRGHALSFIDPAAVKLGLSEKKIALIATANQCQTGRGSGTSLTCLLYPSQDYVRLLNSYDATIDDSAWEYSKFSVSCPVLQALSENQAATLFSGPAGLALKENLACCKTDTPPSACGNTNVVPFLSGAKTPVENECIATCVNIWARLDSMHAQHGNCTDSLVVGESCQPSCNAGYAGGGDVQCVGIPGNRANGKTDVSLLCSPKPCQIPSWPAHGMAGTCPPNMILKSGESCTPGCTAGYYHAPKQLTCNLGRLTPATPEQCFQDCDATKFSPPKNGKLVSCTGTVHSGDGCAFTCDTGYLPGGSMQCEKGAIVNTARCNRACSDALEGGQCTCVTAGCVAVPSCSQCEVRDCQSFFPKKFARGGRANCKESSSKHNHGNDPRPSTNDAQKCESIGVTSSADCNARCNGGTSSSQCVNADCACKCNKQVICVKTHTGIGAGVWILLLLCACVGSSFGYVWWKKKNNEPLPTFLEKLPFLGGGNSQSNAPLDASYRPI